MPVSVLTQQQAHELARIYNLANFDNLKTERVTTPSTDIASCWLATKNRDARCYVQYHTDELDI